MGKLIPIGKAFERFLFSGDQEGLRQVLHPDMFYEMSGQNITVDGGSTRWT